MTFTYRHWKTRDEVTELVARANGLAPAKGERWSATQMTPYRHPNGRRMNARRAVELGWLPASDVEDPMADRPHTGSPANAEKALRKQQELQASADSSEAQARAGYRHGKGGA